MIVLPFSAFVLSLVVCFLLVSNASSVTLRGAAANDLKARQASHSKPTPRIGGLSLAISAVPLMFLVEPGTMSGQALIILVSAVPIFLVGLTEDVFRNVSSKARYGAAIVSGLIAVLFLDLWIDRADPNWFSAMLAFAPFGIAVTVFTTASYSHAFNLIDGLNGLCAGTSLLISLGLVAVAVQSGQTGLIPLLLFLAAGLAGFFLWNFPFGKIFLGDAGAYTLGHVLSWIGVLLIANTTDVSAWAIMLIFFWPLADTLFAIARRLGSGQSIDTPDRMHFHQLMMRVFQLTLLDRSRRGIANPLATAAMLPGIGITIVTGAVFWNNSVAAAIALIAYGAIFVLLHWILRRVAQQMRIRHQAQYYEEQLKKAA